MPKKGMDGFSYENITKVTGSSPNPQAVKKGSTLSHGQSLKEANGRSGPNLESLRS